MSLQNSIRFQYVFFSNLTKHLSVIVSILTRHALGTYIESHTDILFTKMKVSSRAFTSKAKYTQ